MGICVCPCLNWRHPMGFSAQIGTLNESILPYLFQSGFSRNLSGIRSMFGVNQALADELQLPEKQEKLQKPNEDQNTGENRNHDIRGVDVAYKFIMQPFIWFVFALCLAITGYSLDAIAAQKIKDRRPIPGIVISFIGQLLFVSSPLVFVGGWLIFGWGLL